MCISVCGVYLSDCACVCIFMSVSLSICISLCVSVYVCLNVCMCASVYVCFCLGAFVYLSVCLSSHHSLACRFEVFFSLTDWIFLPWLWSAIVSCPSLDREVNEVIK